MSRDIYELIEKMIDKKVKGADTYINNGNRWLIFTDEKKWIFELTKEGTLWYNYYFFERIFKLISLNVGENQHHITKWVENFIPNGVKHTKYRHVNTKSRVDNTIQNGVKETKHNPFEDGLAMEEAIQNGIKETTAGGYLGSVEMKGTTVHQFEHSKQDNDVEDVIESGIKETKYCELHSLMRADHIIKDGIKETWGYEKQSQMIVNEVINKGKKTIWNNDTTKL